MIAETGHAEQMLFVQNEVSEDERRRDGVHHDGDDAVPFDAFGSHAFVPQIDAVPQQKE